MKSIYTLVPDVYYLLQSKDWQSEIGTLQIQLQGRPSQEKTLRLSKMGRQCPRSLWYSFHKPELAEPIPPWVILKFQYGHLVEELVKRLIVAAGHRLEGEDDEIVVDGVTGHRDCVVDGCVVDIKSLSSRSFEKFESKSLAQDDPFGYLEQIDGYVVGSANDPLVTVKDRGYLLGVDKTLGHIVLYDHEVREEHIRQRISESKRIVARDTPPPCTCETRRDKSSGRLVLGMQASYNPFKFQCFPNLERVGVKYFVDKRM